MPYLLSFRCCVSLRSKSLFLQIEEANRVCIDAKKRYETAEIEFVESKVLLHKSNERKEQLTDHLMLIIQEVFFTAKSNYYQF